LKTYIWGFETERSGENAKASALIGRAAQGRAGSAQAGKQGSKIIIPVYH
jgi:hypothetical protein